ncbi:MAG: DNA repair protein RecN [Clostridiales bacterium]|jgi:DNA repair protein RecN (Recombination protein N)|nr:DNA repair protein RecN [Clostridiales bacterium]
MIESLNVKNVALVEEVQLYFSEGLNIISGETGAGKSILLDALTFVLGSRPDREFIRHGASQAIVEALITVTDPRNVSALKEFGVELDENSQFLISRAINKQGRGSCKINGKSVTVGMLKEVSRLLADIHGQHEHQSLLSVANHIRLLDQFCEIDEDKTWLADTLDRYKEIIREIKYVTGNEKDRAARLEILNYQANEIKAARLKPDEEEELTLRRKTLNAADKIYKNAQLALAILKESNISGAAELLKDLSSFSATCEELAIRLEETAELVNEVTHDLLTFADGLDNETQTIEDVELRLDVIYRLKKKYGLTLADVLAHYENVTRELAEISRADEKLARLNAEKKKRASQMLGLSNRISEVRKTQGQMLSAEIIEALKFLGMENASFEVNISRLNGFTSGGFDHVEFMISPNAGEPLKPLATTASGGEMSRVMLALKSVIAEADPIESFIFDEIDAGVSGRTAQQVAEKLRALAENHQIICITHLPQIAAMADSHFLIEKLTDGKKTVTMVNKLKGDALIAELARLIGGAKITDATLTAAAELKSLAR